MASLLTLPAEVLHLILQSLGPCDIGAVNGSCSQLNGYLKDNELLYKTLYLENWVWEHYLFQQHIPSLTHISLQDRPTKQENSAPTWETDLQNYIRLQKILSSTSSDPYPLHRKELPFICATVESLLSAAHTDSESSTNIAYLTSLFPSALISTPLLTSSSLYTLSWHDGPGSTSTFAERQLSAKLHVYYGVPCTTDNSPVSSPIHPFARARVYDLRRYTDSTAWGPFLDTGSQGVDWEKLEAIMLVLHYNLTFVCIRDGGQFPLPMWEKPFLGVTPYSYVAQPRLCPHARPASTTPSLASLLFSIPGANNSDSDDDAEADRFTKSILSRCPGLPTSARDPFAVTGTWMRVVCFLDYSELFQFNFTIDGEIRYSLEEKPDLEPLDTEEAVRMIVMRLKVTKIRAPRVDVEGDQGDSECDWNGWPVVEFKGTSRSLHSAWDPNANSFIRGACSMSSAAELTLADDL